MDDCEWILDPGAEHSEGTHFFIGEIGNTEPLHYWRYASVRWDGCMHLYRAWNYPFTKENDHNRDSDCDCQHICGVEDEIDKLKGLLVAIKKYYPKCET